MSIKLPRTIRSGVLLPLTAAAFTIGPQASSAELQNGSNWNVDPILENIPSAYWPSQVTSTQKIVTAEKTISTKNRATLIRIEGNSLLLDFGRFGIHTVAPEKTDFYELLSDYISGEREKEFTNMSLLVANKLMDFGRGDESGAIRFDTVKDLELYILIYLDQYTPEMAVPLVEFEKAYSALKSQHPYAEVVLMPVDREFYNFGFTVGYSVPFISTHMRIGYIESLAHDPSSHPYMAITDANGRLLHKSEVELETMGEALIDALSVLNINVDPPQSEKEKRSGRAASWLSN